MVFSHLGQVSNQPIKKVDLIPWEGKKIVVEIRSDEFTSVCPITGQPDFASLHLTYKPKKSLVETKSLKLYFLSFREEKAFNEVLCDRIVKELFDQIQPYSMTLVMEFNKRGGLGVTATSTRCHSSGTE